MYRKQAAGVVRADKHLLCVGHGKSRGHRGQSQPLGEAVAEVEKGQGFKSERPPLWAPRLCDLRPVTSVSEPVVSPVKPARRQPPHSQAPSVVAGGRDKWPLSPRPQLPLSPVHLESIRGDTANLGLREVCGSLSVHGATC